jgi:hypothetical protein
MNEIERSRKSPASGRVRQALPKLPVVHFIVAVDALVGRERILTLRRARSSPRNLPAGRRRAAFVSTERVLRGDRRALVSLEGVRVARAGVLVAGKPVSLPGHRRNLRVDDPGGNLSRYQGSRSDPLPKLPVGGVTRAPGLYHAGG